MLHYKKAGLRVLFSLELLIFFVWYVNGPEGLQVLARQKEENKKIAQRIEKLVIGIERLSKQVKKWEQNPFYQEKVAREQLQMARPIDEVYRVTELSKNGQ